MISRADADELLRRMPMGSFLIRVSVKIWGYTVSVKCECWLKLNSVNTLIYMFLPRSTRGTAFHDRKLQEPLSVHWRRQHE